MHKHFMKTLNLKVLCLCGPTGCALISVQVVSVITN